jgi:hypothetical protein
VDNSPTTQTIENTRMMESPYSNFMPSPRIDRGTGPATTCSRAAPNGQWEISKAAIGAADGSASAQRRKMPIRRAIDKRSPTLLTGVATMNADVTRRSAWD